MLNDKNKNQQQDEESAACEADAAEARRRGTELIENHLSQHIAQNPGSSYVTWIACLHPENAEVTIDERFLIPGNPWWTVYEGAKADIPTATATPVVTVPTPTNSAGAGASVEGGQFTSVVPSGHPPNSTSKAGSSTALPTPKPDENAVSKKATGLDLVIGSVLSIIAVLTVFGIEGGAYAVYIVSAGFYKMAQLMNPPSALTGIFYSVFLLVYYSLSLVDSCLLIASVLVTEIVALALFLLSFLFAGYDMAKRWHQYIRRTCHLVRWAFRSKSSCSHPPRHLCLVCSPNKQEEEEEDGDKKDTGAVGAAATYIEKGDDQYPQWLVGEPTTATPLPTNSNKENWIDKTEAAPRQQRGSVTPTAPPSEEHDVIVLDETNVFVDDNGNIDKVKKESHYPW